MMTQQGRAGPVGVQKSSRWILTQSKKDSLDYKDGHLSDDGGGIDAEGNVEFEFTTFRVIEASGQYAERCPQRGEFGGCGSIMKMASPRRGPVTTAFNSAMAPRPSS